MTVKKYAKKLGVSVSTIYRRIRQKLIKAVKRKRRWVITTEEKTTPKPKNRHVEWPWYVRQDAAMEDGLSAEDFIFDHLLPSTPYLKTEIRGRRSNLMCICDVPKDIPITKEGMCVSSVQFRVLEWKGKKLLAEADSLPVNGKAMAWVSNGKRVSLWKKCGPGQSLKICVEVFLRMYYVHIDEKGKVHGRLDYLRGNQGYAHGEKVRSGPYILSQDYNGVLGIKHA